MFREARVGDFEDVVRLYRQLQPEDPVLLDGSDAVAFEEILMSPGLHTYVLEQDRVVVATTYLNVIPNLTRRRRRTPSSRMSSSTSRGVVPGWASGSCPPLCKLPGMRAATR